MPPLLFKEIPTSLPIYDSLNKQDRFRAVCQYECSYRNIAHHLALPAFQFDGALTAAVIGWEIKKIDGSTALVIPDVGPIHHKDLPVKGIRRFWFYSGIGGYIDPPLEEGFYYYEIETNVSGIFYSEVFYIMAQPAHQPNRYKDVISLSWSNTLKDVADILYNIDPIYGQYYNIVHLDAAIDSTEEELIEEVEADGNGEEIPVFQRLVVRYKMQVFLPEYLKRAFAIAQLHDYHGCNLNQGAGYIPIKNFRVDSATPDDGGCMYIVNLSFEQDIVLTNKSCPQNMV